MNFFTIPLNYCCNMCGESTLFTKLVYLCSRSLRGNALCLLLLLLVNTGLSLTAVAQDNVAVRGRVSDADGSPLTGVSVSVDGTGTGSTTDASGNYSINAPKDGILVFSYVGFVS